MSINGENNELEDMGNIQKETKEKIVNEKDDDDEGGTDIVVKGVTLSKSRIDITFPEIDDNEDVTVKTYKSIPYREDKLDIDLPNFSLTKLKKTHWKASQGCSYLLFTMLYGISVIFIYSEKTKAYFTLILISHIFLFLATLIEWCYFKKGCIGYSNLNSKLKKNIDKSCRAKILRSEFGIKYFISFMASIIFLIGDFIFAYSDKLKIEQDEAKLNLVYYNLFGMMALALSQIMKLDKILNLDNRISYLKNDFSKSLYEIFFFFASLLEGGAFMIQLFNMHMKLSPFYLFHLIIKIFDGVLFIASGFILQFNYFYNDFCGK